MSKKKTHILHHYLDQITDKMASDYSKIYSESSDDPGFAGRQGEKNWKKLLEGWLPRSYKVVTDGKIINHDGCYSPQLDVVVLKDIYPQKLIDEGEKIYLAAGVVAAFECKNTLKAEHIEQAVKTSVKVKDLYRARNATPYQELHAPIVYGLLAHSHSWKGDNSKPEENIERSLWNSDINHVSHPRFSLDFICVADLGAWVLSKYIINITQNSAPGLLKRFRPGINVETSYLAHTYHRNKNSEHYKPIGTLISRLSSRLAWENPFLRDLVDYYQKTSIEGGGSGKMRQWPNITIKNKCRPDSALEVGFTSHNYWDEWNGIYF